MNYGVRKTGVVEHGVKMHQKCIFYIDIDERVYDGNVVISTIADAQITEQQSPLLVELVDH